uniref:Uncharacterized protein n=1 Tax=Glossina morsitans morsitans TaxID=37546 RepID=A0ABK9NG28_GLOMM
MSVLIDKRKRNREDDLLCESTPLSKRINNLHLSNFEDTNLNHQQQSQHNNHIYQAIQGNNNNHHSHHQYLSKDIITQSLTQQQHMESLPQDPIDVVQKATYNPDLNEVDNPYYYAKNKLLHELHMERLKRCSL